jgi:hypothetical protein
LIVDLIGWVLSGVTTELFYGVVSMKEREREIWAGLCGVWLRRYSWRDGATGYVVRFQARRIQGLGGSELLWTGRCFGMVDLPGYGCGEACRAVVLLLMGIV